MHAWVFRTRFRRAAFGWRRSRLAIKRLHEALAEYVWSPDESPLQRPKAPF
jgi:hypothetical protein